MTVKKFLCLTLSLIIILFSSSCSMKNDENIEEKKVSFSSEFNFVKSEYEEKYNEINKDLVIKENSSVILISGDTSSGDIEVNLLYDGVIKETYNISKLTEEFFDITELKNGKWVVNIKINKETEGHLKIEVK